MRPRARLRRVGGRLGADRQHHRRRQQPRRADRAHLAVPRLRRGQLHDDCRKGRRCWRRWAPSTPRRVHVRIHFLLNTGDGTPAMKWGSTNVYTEDAAGNPVYTWTHHRRRSWTRSRARRAAVRRDRVHAAGAVDAPDAVPNSSTTALDGGASTRRRTTRNGASSSGLGRRTRTRATRMSRRPGCGSSGTSRTSATGTGRPPNTPKLYDYTEAALHGVIPTRRWAARRWPSRQRLLDAVPAALRDGNQRRHRQDGDAARPGDVPRQGRRRRRQRPRRDEPRPPAALHRTGFTAVAAFAAIQADAHLRHRGGPRRLRGLPGQHDARDGIASPRPTARTKSR